MKKILILTTILAISLFAQFSLLAPAVPQPLADLNNLVTQRSNQVKSKLDSMEKGVIENIQKQIEEKEYNTTRLKKLSKLDYITNKEYVFLVKKLNEITNNSIDSQNVTTTGKSIKLKNK